MSQPKFSMCDADAFHGFFFQKCQPGERKSVNNFQKHLPAVLFLWVIMTQCTPLVTDKNSSWCSQTTWEIKLCPISLLIHVLTSFPCLPGHLEHQIATAPMQLQKTRHTCAMCATWKDFFLIWNLHQVVVAKQLFLWLEMLSTQPAGNYCWPRRMLPRQGQLKISMMDSWKFRWWYDFCRKRTGCGNCQFPDTPPPPQNSGRGWWEKGTSCLLLSEIV